MRKNRIGYGIILVSTLFLLLFYHNYFFLVFLIGMILLPGVSYGVTRYTVAHCEVEVGLAPAMLTKEQMVTASFLVKNPTMFVLPAVHVCVQCQNDFYENEESQEMIFAVARGNHCYEWELSSIYAGNVSLREERIFFYDYLGLFCFSNNVQQQKKVAVFPKRIELIVTMLDESLSIGQEEEVNRYEQAEDVTSLRDVREYQPGDRLQKIHWKLSTKQDKLMVKEFEWESNRTRTLLLELNEVTEQGGLDALIEVWYSAACYFLEQEVSFFACYYNARTSTLSTSNVESGEDLNRVLFDIYECTSYEGQCAYEAYEQEERKEQDVTLYVAPYSYPIEGTEQIVTYKEQVRVVCF